MRGLPPAIVILSFLAASCSSGDDDDGGSDRITVSGEVTSAYGGPVSGVSVLIAGRTSTTDSAGLFTFDDVETPYDLAFYDTVFSSGTMFLGVTRPDPRFVGFRIAEHTGTLELTLSPATGGTPRIAVAGFVFAGVSASADSADVTPAWSGATTQGGRVFASRVLSTGSMITDILDHGAADFVVEDGLTIALSLPMNAVTDGPLVATVNPPPGYDVEFVDAANVLDGGSTASLLLGQTQLNPASFVSMQSALYDTRVSSFAVPSGGSLSSGYGMETRTVDSGTTGVTLSPPTRLELVTPGIGGTLGAGLPVEWTGPLAATALYRVIAQPVDGTGSFFMVWTSQTTLLMPDVSAIGGVFAAEPYYVFVEGSDPAASVDSMLGGLTGPTDGMVDYVRSVAESRTVTGVP